MDIEGRLQNLAARCLSAVVHYDFGERKKEVEAEMAAQLGVVVEDMLATHPTGDEIREGILRPVEAYLLARHGHETGARISQEFLRAYEAALRDRSPRTPGKEAEARRLAGPPASPGRSATSPPGPPVAAPVGGRPAHGAREDHR